MNTIESEFGFDEYIMPTTYSTVPKLEPFDAQLYPSGNSDLFILYDVRLIIYRLLLW